MVSYAEEEKKVSKGVPPLKQLYANLYPVYLDSLREDPMPGNLLQDWPDWSLDKIAEIMYCTYLKDFHEFHDIRPPLPVVLVMAEAFRRALLTVLRELKG